MMKRPGERSLRIGLVGHGFMGRVHSLAWRMADQVYGGPVRPVLAVLAGRQKDRAEHAAAQFGFESALGDWQLLMDRPDIDVIDICTPVDSHAEIAAAALAAGKHVLCEKPLARTSEEALMLVSAAARAREHGSLAVVGYNYRRLPAVALAKQLVDGGRIGTLRHVRASYFQDWLSHDDVPWTWRLDHGQAGYGALGDIGSHLVDLVAHVTGGRLSSVVGTLDTFVTSRRAKPVAGTVDGHRAVTVDDACAFVGRTTEGLTAVFETSRCAPGRKNHLQLELHGSAGTIVFDLERLNELRVYSDAVGHTANGFRTVLVTNPSDPYLDAWWPPGHTLGWDHSFVHQAGDFIAALASGQACAPDFADGLYVQEVLEAVAISAKTGTWRTVSRPAASLPPERRDTSPKPSRNDRTPRQSAPADLPSASEVATHGEGS